MTGDRGLVDRSALELRDLIAGKAVSPVEVLEAHLAEIARLNPALNAIVTLAEEQARAREQEQAQARALAEEQRQRLTEQRQELAIAVDRFR